MNKFLEIPIYAMNMNKLNKLFEDYEKSHFNETSNLEHKKICVDKMTYPQRISLYNHIVGYISVNFDDRNIYYSLFCTRVSRYFWLSKIKHHMYYMPLSRFLFEYNELSDEEFKSRILNDLKTIIRLYVNKRFYVDLNSYERLIKSLSKYEYFNT